MRRRWLALFAGLAILAGCAGSSGDVTTATSTTAAATAIGATEDDQSARAGQPVPYHAGQASLTIMVGTSHCGPTLLSAGITVQGVSQPTPVAGQFCSMMVTAINTGQTPAEVNGVGSKLEDDQGRTFDQANLPGYQSTAPPLLRDSGAVARVQPTLQKSGVLLFDVPADSVPATLWFQARVEDPVLQVTF